MLNVGIFFFRKEQEQRIDLGGSDSFSLTRCDLNAYCQKEKRKKKNVQLFFFLVQQHIGRDSNI